MNWNIALNRLLSPDHRHYVSVGDCARILSILLKTAETYREPGRWGSTGPTEVLTDYGGCTNSQDQEWHSQRRHHFTYDEHRDGLIDSILNAVCVDGEIYDRWRKEHDVHLFRQFKRINESFNADKEREAWNGFTALHMHRLPVETLNPCHRNIRVLCFPQLIISRGGIYIRSCVTNLTELRQSGHDVKHGSTASRWDVSSLTHRRYPEWRPHREKFSDFIVRGVDWIKNKNATTPRDR